MATRTRRSQRRTEALSRERIVETAVELLDTAGEGGLTFRALTQRLATGPGAVYWHVANKEELLAAATEGVVTAALETGPADPASATGPADPARSPRDGIRAVALALSGAIEEHPWLAAQLAAQLARNPWGTVTARIFESIGRQVAALGVPESTWFTAASALLHYILGATGQNAVNAGGPGPEPDRAEFLGAVSAAWRELDPDDYPFTRAVADQMREHDDREQFLAGIDFVLTGITTLHPPG
ncbi:TetR/AcrR family transcriptional regulator [Streptomyces sp. NPDC001068]|uniref:TetR/AcrR family transcriptional regulator n=1 Tax=Streptomyces sp. NPDC001068 TaxID=3364544 RepID=UPI0036A8DF0B